MHRVTDLQHSLLMDDHWRYVVDLAAIPHTDHAHGDSEQEKLPFNKKKLPAEPEPGSAWAQICRHQLKV